MRYRGLMGRLLRKKKYSSIPASYNSFWMELRNKTPRQEKENLSLSVQNLGKVMDLIKTFNFHEILAAMFKY